MRLLSYKREAYTVKKVIDFPVPCPVTSRLGTGKPLTFLQCRKCGYFCIPGAGLVSLSVCVNLIPHEF
jgi:hypothetical protein